jgi:hypothetical protein
VAFVDRDHLATAGDDGDDGVVHLSSISEGRVVSTLRLARDSIRALAAIDGKVVAGTFLHEIHIWTPDPHATEPLLAMPDPKGSLLRAEFIPGARELVTIGWCKTQQSWDAKTGILRRQVPYSGSRWDISVSQYAVSSALQAAWDTYETAIETRDSETPVAWWPESLTVARFPTNTVWGGGAGNHVVIFHLEGLSRRRVSLFGRILRWLGM